MKIHIPLVEVKDQLISLISEGFAVLGFAFTMRHDENGILLKEQEWSNKAYVYLDSIFPTRKEAGQFLYTPYSGFIYTGMSANAQDAVNKTDNRIKILTSILNTLEQYYQFEPDTTRLYIQQIDSFSKVRGINFDQIKKYVENGYFKEKEKSIKQMLAAIVGESFVPNDHGGETEDLYTSRFLLNGERVQTSVILNGPGKVKSLETRTKDLGAQGDQLERMMRTNSSKLYILQSVKPVGQDIVHTFDVFIKDQRSKGNHCYYCIIDGQDTATILYAYGYLTD